MELREIWWGGMDWIDLAQDRDQWRALVNVVTNLRVPKMLRSSWLAARLAASQEGLSTTKWVLVYASNDAVNNTHYMEWNDNWLLNNKFSNVRKEVFVAYFKALSRYLLPGTEESHGNNSVFTADYRTDFWTRDVGIDGGSASYTIQAFGDTVNVMGRKTSHISKHNGGWIYVALENSFPGLIQANFWEIPCDLSEKNLRMISQSGTPSFLHLIYNYGSH
jgi:hypothetical protein